MDINLTRLKFETFLLGTHGRVGRNCKIGLLCDDVFSLIWDCVREACFKDHCGKVVMCEKGESVVSERDLLTDYGNRGMRLIGFDKPGVVVCVRNDMACELAIFSQVVGKTIYRMTYEAFPLFRLERPIVIKAPVKCNAYFMSMGEDPNNSCGEEMLCGKNTNDGELTVNMMRIGTDGTWWWRFESDDELRVYAISMYGVRWGYEGIDDVVKKVMRCHRCEVFITQHGADINKCYNMNKVEFVTMLIRQHIASHVWKVKSAGFVSKTICTCPHCANTVFNFGIVPSRPKKQKLMMEY